MTGVYCIRNIENNKVYIGQSIDIKRRWRKHKSELNRNVHNNKHLQSAWNKYGKDAFEFNVLIECTEDKLDSYETEYIRLYHATDRQYGYCDMDGGQKYRHHSEETKRKCGEKNIGRHLSQEIIDNLRKINTGRPLSEEHKRKISESNKGRKKPHLGNNNKKIRCKNTGDVFESILKAAEWCGLKNSGNISSCAKGMTQYAGVHPISKEKLKWEYA